jgi:RNA 3'-terminal phosphate cyclase
VIIGGKDLEHDCGLQRGIGYFLEPLILLGLFGRSPLSIRLKGENHFLSLSSLFMLGVRSVSKKK